MNLQIVLDHLRQGELSQISFGADGCDTPETREKIIHSVELGLSDLHKRFLLKEGVENVELLRQSTAYTLQATDLVQIERIEDEDGNALSVNDPYALYGITLMGDKSFYIHKDFFKDRTESSKTIRAFYRAKPKEINKLLAVAYPAGIEIDLPDTYLQALLYYVASRVHTPIGLTKEFHQGNDYLGKYEAEVARLLQHNIRLDRIEETDRFSTSGWA
jgi:hypothetical protein